MKPARRVIKDLGELSGEVLVFGGPYSNLQATEALFSIARNRSIPASNRICTGDAVAYCANPVETVELLTDNCEWVAGNCEKQFAEDADDCGCGFEDGSTCDVLSRGWYAFANKVVFPEHRRQFSLCPDMIIFGHNGSRYAVIHGGFTDISRFIWSISDDDVFDAEINAIQAEVGKIDTIFCGHSGIAFKRVVGNVLWVNAGAIGMPQHDCNTATRYVSLGPSGVEFENLSYDFNAAAAEMVMAGLEQGYETALKTGLWPSEDVLPSKMRR